MVACDSNFGVDKELYMAPRKPVTSRINATDARQFFGNVIQRAFAGGEHLIVEKNDLPVVVIVPIADYEKMQEAMALQNLKELGSALHTQIRAQNLTQEEVDEQIEQTKRKVYQERYG
jgi:prevent-host-death family protein